MMATRPCFTGYVMAPRGRRTSPEAWVTSDTERGATRWCYDNALPGQRVLIERVDRTSRRVTRTVLRDVVVVAAWSRP